MSIVTDPIAIVGLACRLPGRIDSMDGLWQLLAQGRDAVTEIPAERWPRERFFHPRRSMAGRCISTAAGIIENIYDFDAEFFGISNKEAEAMDPQQRLMLELAWESLEDARILPSALAGSRTAVFVGAASPDAGSSHADDICATNAYSMTGVNLSIISNRISYIFDLHGPSMTIDTACSSAMYALHQACQTLASNGADMALAGGVNALLSPYPFVGFSQAYMLSPDGRCKVFDAEGNGYVRAEGGGLLLLQPLEDALAAGRRIHGVIRAVGINSDGRTHGIALPNAESQENLLRLLYDSAGIAPEMLSYLEAHGTGTAAGDPVETRAIGRALGMRRRRPLLTGSVKCHLGHLETASAMAGICKTLLVLRERRVPPQILISRLNPAIDFKALNLRVPLRMTPLPHPPRGRRLPLAGVNSFGFGGANGHVLLEAAPSAPRKRPRFTAAAAVCGAENPPFFLSARSEASLRQAAGLCADVLENGTVTPYDLAAGMALQRETLPHRLAVHAPHADAALSALRAAALPGGEPDPAHALLGECVFPRASGRTRTVFVYSGNGSQWAGMGQRLMEDDPAFARAAEEAAHALKPLSGKDYAAMLRGGVTEEDIALTELAQPLLFVMQFGLTAAFLAKGITPDMVLGHSVGEVAAAWACGALALADAALVIHHRSLLQGRTRGLGRMAAANLSPEAALALPELRAGRLELAGMNTPDSVTLSGDAGALAAVGERMREQHVFFRELPLDYAFHSAAMDTLEVQLRAALRGLRPRRARIPFISTVTGEELNGSRLNAGYWWRNIRQPVLFGQAADTAVKAGGGVFMEVGPHPVLQHYVRSALNRARIEGATMGCLTRDGDCARGFHQAWRKAWISGWPARMETFFPSPSRAERLPKYPWNRQRQAIAPTPECAGLLRGEAEHPLLGWRKPEQKLWENTLDLQSHPWLKDHQVGNSVFFPAAAYLEMALAAARLAQPAWTPVELLNTAIYRPMIFLEDTPLNLRSVVEDADGEIRLLCRSHMRADAWALFARGRMTASHTPAPLPLEAARSPESFGQEQDAEELYALTHTANMRYGPVFRPVTRLWRKGDSVLARLAPPAEAAAQGMLMPPPLLDGGLQLIFKLIEDRVREHPAPLLPYWFERCTLFRPGVPVFALARLERVGERTVACSLDMLDADGNALLRLTHGRARLVERLAALEQPSVYCSRLVPAPHALAAGETAPPAPPHIDSASPVMTADERSRTEEILSLRHMAAFAMALERLEALADSETAVRPALAMARGLWPSGHEALLCYLLELLERQGIARRMEDRPDAWVLERPEYLPPFEDIWRTLLAEDPSGLAETHMLGRARDLLRGDAMPSEKDDDQLAESYFRFSPSLRRNNALVAESVRVWLEACPEGTLPHIMEIGAAPGGLLRSLLPVAAKHDCRYTVTDSNAEALEHMREVVSPPRGARLSFQTLALPGDNDDGTHTPSLAHCLLLGYCLHQTDNVAASLRRCRELLTPGGLLVLAELAPGPPLDIFFGQRPSWWERSPSPQAPASRFMPPQEWRKTLEQAGFTDIRLVHAANSDEHPTEAFVLLARSANTVLPALPAEPAGGETEKLFVLLADSRPALPAAALLDALRHLLEKDGGRVLTLRPGKLRLEGAEWRLRPHSAEDWAMLWQVLAAEKKHLICVDCLDMGSGAALDPKAALRRVAAVTQLARGWEKAGRPPLHLRVITAGAQPFGRAAPAQSCVLGALRTLMNEMPALDARCLDVDGMEDAALPRSLARELLHPDAEREVVLHGSRRYAPRIALRDDPLSFAEDGGARTLRLECRKPGRLETLVWRPSSLGMPGPGEILVRVRAAGLNFRDVMWAMGFLPEEALENGFSGTGLGIECAGEVEALGPEVTDLYPGQRVACFGPRCLGSHARTSAAAAIPIPEGWSFASAATVPVAFFTAWYALRHLARMTPGERVLIHGAAGGVGMAAIQVASHLGLEVFATAGTPDKRSLLRLSGVSHVLDSRSYAFREQVLELTNGQGVDAVLNSLAGEGIGHSLGALRPFGRFLELGKRDVYADNPLRLRLLRNNISLFCIDVDQLMRERPVLGQKLFRDIMALFVEGVWRPLPHTIFTAHEAEDAFRGMQQSRHIGKIVLEVPQPEVAEAADSMPVRQDGSYVVTGGMNGFGLAAARYLAGLGAGALVLVGRGGPRTAEAREAIASLCASGCAVREAYADVSRKSSLFSALDAALHGLPPLRGIVHAAAALDDAVIANLTLARIRRVLEPKVTGAFHLHEYSLGGQGRQLDFFMLFSSATTLMGNPGQANYVAANMALEGLAAMRRASGLPALAVGWGAIADAGVLARNPATLQSLRKVGGIAAMKADAALRMLPALHGMGPGALAVLAADWKKICRLPVGATPRLEALRPTSGGPEDAVSMLLSESVAGKTPQEAREIITTAVVTAVAVILRVPPTRIRPTMPLADMGMDSLMVVELGLALEELLGGPPPVDSLSAGSSARDIVEALYSFLCGNDKNEAGALRRDLENKHGIKVNDDFARLVLENTEVF